MWFDGLYLRWTWNAAVIAQVVLLSALYLVYLGPIRRRLMPQGMAWLYPVRWWQIAAFFIAVAFLFISEISPLYDLANRYSLAFHMVRVLLLTELIPVLLLVGTPSWALRHLLSRVGQGLNWLPLSGVGRILVHPLVAFALFNEGLVLWHIPQYAQLCTVDPPFYGELWHTWQELTFLGTALLVWTSVVGPLQEYRLTWLLRLVYLFALSIIPGVIGAFPTFATDLIYGYYALTPKPLGMDAMTDQLIGGLIMKVFGSIPLWLIITVDFFSTFSREEKGIPEHN
jgi:cytochrome c oxidase assembly factor CtaG